MCIWCVMRDVGIVCVWCVLKGELCVSVVGVCVCVCVCVCVYGVWYVMTEGHKPY